MESLPAHIEPKFDFGEKYGENFLNQPVLRVCGFSSQYGSDLPPEPTGDRSPVLPSYSIKNLEGEASVFPTYGDAIRAGVFRTYGGYWQKSKLNLDNDFAESKCDDFVDLFYQYPVYPAKVEIYETFNVGHVYRISCGLADSPSSPVDFWSVLWTRTARDLVVSEESARIFRVPIKPCDRKVNVLRLEMQTRGTNYYPELDAVLLGGFTEIVIEQAGPSKNDDQSQAEKENCLITLDQLPPEILRYIVTFCKNDSEKLELLVKMSGVCRKIRSALNDPDLLETLDLKPLAIRSFTRESLEFFADRSNHLRKLRLSWLPDFKMEAPIFIATMRNLTHLNVQSCSFVDDEFLEKLTTSTQNSCLEHLDLSSCRHVTPRGFHCLANLKKIRRISLYRTLIDQFTLRLVLSSFRKLEAVNLGSLTLLSNCDAICSLLAECAPLTLKAVDFWRAGSTLTNRGLKELFVCCRNLEELDAGWCPRIDTTSFKLMAEMCPRMRRIMLTANRCVTDEDLERFAQKFADLEQLDLLGSFVSLNALVSLLSSCQNMSYLDVAYCGLQTEELEQLHEMFPNVHIPTPSHS